MKNISTQTIILWTATKPWALQLHAIRIENNAKKTTQQYSQQIVIIPNPTQYDFV